jgi:SNF2 family DNA or RNA helicase
MQQITSEYLPVMREYYDENDKLHHELDRVEKIDSGKTELLEEIIEDISEEEPVVVFCRFKHDLDEIKAVAEKLGRTYGEISGSRKDALDDKAELQDGIQIAGVQIQAGGVGIDLTKSHYCIYYSVGYSLGDYEQSLARIHRPGQTKPVFYYHLVASGTIDEVIYSNLKNKKDVISTIIETKKLEGEE